MRRRSLTLKSDQRGAAAVEFALVAPFMLLGLLGIFDIGQNMYTATLLRGAIYKAARDSTIEGAGGRTSSLDQRVADVVHDIAPGATLEFERTSYASFKAVGEPEDFTDIDGNGACDSGEPYEDANGNGTWDADRGKAGLGGARDAVVYQVTVTFPRAFPVYKLIGAPASSKVQAQSILRNQPYGGAATEILVRSC